MLFLAGTSVHRDPLVVHIAGISERSGDRYQKSPGTWVTDVTFQFAILILDAHVPLIEATELERTEVDVPDAHFNKAAFNHLTWIEDERQTIESSRFGRTHRGRSPWDGGDVCLVCSSSRPLLGH
jgi:hypothetical protein